MIPDEYNLVQKVDFATRYSNTLDLMLTTGPSKVENVRPGAPFSDHDLVISDINLLTKKKAKNAQNYISHILYIFGEVGLAKSEDCHACHQVSSQGRNNFPSQNFGSSPIHH